jgi:hypothetical protein
MDELSDRQPFHLTMHRQPTLLVPVRTETYRLHGKYPSEFRDIHWVSVRKLVANINGQFQTRQISSADIFRKFAYQYKQQNGTPIMTWYIPDESHAFEEPRPPDDYYKDIYIPMEWADAIAKAVTDMAISDSLFYNVPTRV